MSAHSGMYRFDEPTGSPSSGFSYRPSIDGLRAVAVLAVLLFHWDERLLPGGFLGVDIFFVISGYVITAKLNVERQPGDVSLVDFYQRRIARLVPTIVAVGAGTLGVAFLLYTSQDLASAGALAAASALSAANFKLMLQGDYFEVSRDAQPFVHFWSLSVEEQFYLAMPLALVLAHRCGSSPRTITRWMWSVAFLSLLTAAVLAIYRPAWAFYLLPARAWELMAGAILASQIAPRAGTESGRIGRALGGIGIVLIAAAVYFGKAGDSGSLLPQAAAVGGAALVIGLQGTRGRQVERLLAVPVLVAIGRMSFSLYLWHWPVYSFVDYGLYASSGGTRALAKVACTAAFATVSFMWIEAPARTYLSHSARRAVAFSLPLAGLALLALAGIQVRNANYIRPSLDEVAGGGREFKASTSSPTIVLVGDSNGAMYGTVVRELAAEVGANLNVLAVPADDPLPGTDLFAATIAFLSKEKPAVTIFAAAWSQKIGNAPVRLTAAVDAILEHSKYLVLITQPPVLPASASRRAFRTHGVKPIFEDARGGHVRRTTNALLRSLKGQRTRVVDVDPLFTESDGEVRFVSPLGRQLYQDATHLSGDGAALVKIPLQAEVWRLLAAEWQRSALQTEGVQSPQ